jgi:hypothetical protein
MARASHASVPHVVLSAAFIERLGKGYNGWPKPAALRTFCLKRFGIAITNIEKQRAAAARGEPVTRLYGTALVEYVNAKWNYAADANEALLPAQAHAGADGGWENWHSVLDVVTDRFTDCAEMYLHNPSEDLPRIADVVLHNAGEILAPPGPRMTREEYIAHGERVMQCKKPDYIAWLKRIRESQERSVLYVVHPEQKDGETVYKPIGVSIIVPLNDTGYKEFTMGAINYFGVGPEHIASPSKHLFIATLYRFPEASHLSVKELSAAEINCTLYQCAYFTRGIRPFRPSFCTFAAIPQYIERLTRLGFRNNGHVMPGYDAPIMTMAHHKDPGGSAKWKLWARYNMLRLALIVYRRANRDQWAGEGRS